MAIEQSTVDGISYDDNTNTSPNPGINSGKRLKWFGQTSNNPTGNVSNQQVGTASLPATTAGTVGTVVVSNSLVTANSLIFLSPANENATGTFGGDTTAGRALDVWIESVGTGTFTIGYNPRAAMSAAWSCYFFIVN